MKTNNFHYIGVLLDMLYGIELDDETLEELGLLGWNLIGNKNTRMYRFSSNLDCDNSITLPCNAVEGKVEAVTAPYEDWKRTTNYSSYGDLYTAYVEHSIEAERYYNSPHYIPGKLLKYEQVGDKLYFPFNYGRVNILYKGVLMDDDGLPELTDKEATAIATYIAYTQKFKEGLTSNNPNIIQQSALLKQQWLQQCDQARVTYLNQNDMNNILDVKTSCDRHNYNFSSKPMR